MKPGDLVRWKGCRFPFEYGVVSDVGRLGTVTVRTVEQGGNARTLTFRKRLRAGYDRFLRPLVAAERAQLEAQRAAGWR